MRQRNGLNGVPESIIKDGLPFNGTNSDILKFILPKQDGDSPSGLSENQKEDSY